jgi:hypothetical protein
MDEIQDLLKRLANIANVVSEGKVVIAQNSENEIEKVVSHYGRFEVSTVTVKFNSEELHSAGILGELHFDSLIHGPFKSKSADFLKIATEFPASGMQVWATKHPENPELISTGLADVQNVYKASSLISDHALFLVYKRFVMVTAQYLEFVDNNMEKAS